MIVTNADGTAAVPDALVGWVLDAIALPALLLGPAAEVLAANPPARVLLRDHRTLSGDTTRLHPAHPSARQALRRRLGLLGAGPGATWLRLGAGRGRAGLLLLLRRLPGEPGVLLATAMDLEEPPLPDAAWVAGALGLRRPAARAVALLATGIDMPEIAARLGRSQRAVRRDLTAAEARLGLAGARLALGVALAFVAVALPGSEPSA